MCVCVVGGQRRRKGPVLLSMHRAIYIHITRGNSSSSCCCCCCCPLPSPPLVPFETAALLLYTWAAHKGPRYRSPFFLGRRRESVRWTFPAFFLLPFEEHGLCRRPDSTSTQARARIVNRAEGTSWCCRLCDRLREAASQRVSFFLPLVSISEVEWSSCDASRTNVARNLAWPLQWRSVTTRARRCIALHCAALERSRRDARLWHR